MYTGSMEQLKGVNGLNIKEIIGQKYFYLFEIELLTL